jgi:hypothetical protein
MKNLLVMGLLIWTGCSLTGQPLIGPNFQLQMNTLRTAVPFLTIAPDAISTGMGDAGTATTPDVHSQHWNNAKYAFTDGEGGIGLTYTPWLRALIPHINLFYLSGYYKTDEINTFSGSIRYFDLGTLVHAGTSGIPISSYNPFELAVDAGYSRRFTGHFSGGIVLRYIFSDITYRQTTPGAEETKPGTSLAGDLGFYYQREIQAGEKDALLATGLNISNIGTPVSYTEDAEKTPIPTNLRVGGRFLYYMNENHSISLAADANKLLVPTPPVYETDSATGEHVIVAGSEAPESVLLGMLQSFYDAPGIFKEDGTRSVFLEELYEINLGFGAEYRYRDQFAIRAGYYHEHPSKGNRKYYTLGFGARFRSLALDYSYSDTSVRIQYVGEYFQDHTGRGVWLTNIPTSEKKSQNRVTISVHS